MMLDINASFVDLRDFASKTSAAATAKGGGDPFRDHRRLLPLGDGPVAAGLIDLPEGSGSIASAEGDEYVIVIEGLVTLSTGGGELVLRANESAVIPAGTSFDWTAAQPTRLIFMNYQTTAPREKGGTVSVRIDEAAVLQPSNPPLAELLVGPTPSCRNHTDFSSADGTFVCGTWDSTPYHRRPMQYRHHELMHLLAGEVTFEDEAGRAQTFGQGDIFIVKRGSNCSWESKVHVKKVYAIWRP